MKKKYTRKWKKSGDKKKKHNSDDDDDNNNNVKWWCEINLINFQVCSKSFGHFWMI